MLFVLLPLSLQTLVKLICQVGRINAFRKVVVTDSVSNFFFKIRNYFLPGHFKLVSDSLDGDT